jgi:anti-sigma factor RsiW
MNRPDTNIDELLNSLLDGELTESQQVDVARLIASNPQI